MRKWKCFSVHAVFQRIQDSHLSHCHSEFPAIYFENTAKMPKRNILYPITLTFGLWPWPIKVIWSIVMVDPCAKFSCSSVSLWECSLLDWQHQYCAPSRGCKHANMQNCPVHHLVNTKLNCALSKCTLAQNYIVGATPTSHGHRSPLCTTVVHNVALTNPNTNTQTDVLDSIPSDADTECNEEHLLVQPKIRLTIRTWWINQWRSIKIRLIRNDRHCTLLKGIYLHWSEMIGTDHHWSTICRPGAAKGSWCKPAPSHRLHFRRNVQFVHIWYLLHISDHFYRICCSFDCVIYTVGDGGVYSLIYSVVLPGIIHSSPKETQVLRGCISFGKSVYQWTWHHVSFCEECILSRPTLNSRKTGGLIFRSQL